MKSERAIELAKDLADRVWDLGQERLEELVLAPEWLGAILTDAGYDGPEAENIGIFFRWELRSRMHRRAEKKALPLLRSFLTTAQRADMRRHLTFKVRGSAGGVYRLAPWGTRIARCARIGERDYDVVTYCYHDEGSILASADVMLGTMLLIMCDEPAFLAEANARPVERFRRRGVQ